MKKILIIVVLVAVLGGGGFAAWKFFLSGGDEPKKEAVQAQPVKTFHELDPFLVNLADPGGKRYLKASIKLEVNGPEVAKEITDKNFQIRDEILMYLSGLEVDDISLPTGKMTLKREVLNRINRALKNGGVSNIYLTEFLIQ